MLMGEIYTIHRHDHDLFVFSQGCFSFQYPLCRDELMTYICFPPLLAVVTSNYRGSAIDFMFSIVLLWAYTHCSFPGNVEFIMSHNPIL